LKELSLQGTDDMIRYHAIQDFLFAKVVPPFLHGAAGTTATPRSAALAFHGSVYSGSYGAASDHSLAIYTAALPVLLMIAVTVIALLLSWAGRRWEAPPRHLPAAYGSLGGVSPLRRPLPAVLRAKQPVHRAARGV
jgi:hypothetical protein